MDGVHKNQVSLPSQTTMGIVRQLPTLVCAFCFGLAGCASLTNPVSEGIPAHRVPGELLAESRESKRVIPLKWLRRRPPETYTLATGDVLGVYLEGIFGGVNQPPPVNFSDFGNTPPSLGYPVPVRDDGTIPLPLLDPVDVRGLTIRQAESKIIDIYTRQKDIIKPGNERIIVTLIRPRHERIVVVRQDSPGEDLTIRTAGPLRLGGRSGITTTTFNPRDGLGTGAIVDLPFGQNDLLNALTRSGGLPGNDAADDVVIQRGYYDVDEMPLEFTGGDVGARRDIIRIPLRLHPGQAPPFMPEDVVLRTGDIVFVESRGFDSFYAGGLLPTGEYRLPSDYDLDVVEAVMQIQGSLINGGINASNLTGNLIDPGIGSPSPRLLTVVRRAPNGKNVLIRVDLHRALRDPRENLLVKSGDILVLQETKSQAIARYFSQRFFFDFFSDVISRTDTTATTRFMVP